MSEIPNKRQITIQGPLQGPALILIMKLKLTNIKEPVNGRWEARLQKRMVHKLWEDQPLPPVIKMDLLRNVANNFEQRLIF